MGGAKMDKLLNQLKRHEGTVKNNGAHMPYKCPSDKLTIGYGRNIEDRGISDDETEKALALVAINDTTHWQRNSPFLVRAADVLGVTT